MTKARWMVLMILVMAAALAAAATAVVVAEAAESDAAPGEIVAGADGAAPNPAADDGLQGEWRRSLNARRLEAYRARREKERQDAEATSRFGRWGPDLVEAAAMYGQNPAELYRVMSCESGGNPYADNGVNKGLFQFHPSTFAGTPYAGAGIFDGRAQIFAAAWMWSQGRKGEWGCA